MNGKHRALVLAAVVVNFAVAMSSHALTIEPATNLPAATSLPALPLVSDAASAWWTSSAPVWSATSLDITSRLWAATSPTGVLFHVVVTDPVQRNAFHERSLWRGDCIYLAVNARGDDSAEDLRSNDLQLDDAVFIFGLGDRGPEGRVARHGNPAEREADKTALLRSLVRDEAAKTTTYDVAIPWAEFSSAPGQSPAIGLACNVAHKNAQGKDTSWGRFAAGPKTPRELNRFAVSAGAEPFATVAPKRLRLLGEEDAIIGVAVQDSQGATIEATLGSEPRRLDVPPGDGVRRFDVHIPAAAVGPEARDAAVTVTLRSRPTPMRRVCQLVTPGVVMELFARQTARLLETAPNDVVRRHLKSTLAAITAAYARLEWERDEHPQRVETFIDMVQLIAAKLPADRFDWTAHVKQALPLVFAFVSDRDGTLQFFSLQLPYDWEATNTYPLIVYLHGAGDDNPLVGLSTSFDNSHQDTLFRNVDIDPAHVPPSHRGFVLAPWARGNSMYRDAGEWDVWQSMEYAKKHFKVDEDRTYMTGFSMGCSGAWGIAARTPDVWAAVSTASGFGDWSDTSREVLADNAVGLPVKIWIGDLDGMVDGAKDFDRLLSSKDVPHAFTIAKNTPHTYPYDEYEANVGYLLPFTRAKPPCFAFTADTPYHTGRSGITMRVGAFPDARHLPHFAADIKGQTLRIVSRNTTGLRVDLKNPLLGLQGEVTVYWNHRKAYVGLPQVVKLGEGAHE